MNKLNILTFHVKNVHSPESSKNEEKNSLKSIKRTCTEVPFHENLFDADKEVVLDNK